MTSHERIQRLLADSEADPMIGLSMAARLIPGEGRGSISSATVYRWGTRGLPLADGRVVKLAMWRIGRKWVTTRSALAEFIELQQPATPADSNYPRSLGQRNRASDLADETLRKKGV